MNRFIVDYNPDTIAKALCDQHVVKMPLEEAQMLCTSLWHHAPEYAEENELYKPVHQKHPCTLWAMETRANFSYAYRLYVSMLREYNYRYTKWHRSGRLSLLLALYHGIKYIPEGELTTHPQCFSGHDDLKTGEKYPINAYRAFYKRDKMSFARWNKNRAMPKWLHKLSDTIIV